jgi:hypothetical protein
MRAKVLQYLRRQRGAFAIVAAILAFMTFLIKDTLRDQYKEIADSIETARSSLLIETTFIDLHQGIGRLTAAVDDSRLDILAILRPPKVSTPIEMLTSSREFVKKIESGVQLGGSINATAAKFDETSRLIHTVRSGDVVSSQFASLRKRWEQFTAQREASINSTHGEDDLSDEKEYKEITNELNRITNDALNEAEVTKEEKEALVNVFTPISVVLYSLSALLALASKMAGLEEVAQEE